MFKRIARSLPVALLLSLVVAPQADAGGDFIFTKNFDGEVTRQNFDGTGSTVSIGQFGQGANLNIFGDYIYMSYNGIKRMKLDGTDSSTISDTQDVFSIATDGTYFYYGFETAQKIGRMKIDGTNVNDNWVDLSQIWNLFAGDMFIKDGYLYFGGGNNGNGMQIGKVLLSGGSPSLIASVDNSIGGLTTDGSYIYWSEVGGNGLGRVNFDGTNVQNEFITTLGSDIWTVEYSNGYLYALALNSIAKISTDLQSIDLNWRNSYGRRGMAIGGVISNPVQFTSNGDLQKGIVGKLFASFPYPGKATFMSNGKRIPTCINLTTLANSPYSVTCNFKPSVRGSQVLTLKLKPIDPQKAEVTSSIISLVGSRKSYR